jgi:hypothetical protein
MDLLEAIGQAGTSLDKITGGRALRGTLAGKPRELLSVVPFSDALGLTDEHDATGGRDLTDAWGVTRKGDHSLSSNAIGFLADTALSPGNLLGGYGAYKAAPTVAKGLAGAAKSLSGLDLIDSFRTAGSALKGHDGGDLLGALKRFSDDEGGWLRIPSYDMVDVRPPDTRSLFSQLMGLPPAAYLEDTQSVEAVERSRQLVADAMRRKELETLPVFRAQAITDAFNQDARIAMTASPKSLAEYKHSDSWRDPIIQWNPRFHGWFDPVEMAHVRDRSKGFWATDAPDGTALHELGHAFHHNHMGDELFQYLPEEVPTKYMKDIRNNVSEYATTNPKELIAEMFAGMATGHQYDHAMENLYEQFGGPPETADLVGIAQKIQEQLNARFGTPYTIPKSRPGG